MRIPAAIVCICVTQWAAAVEVPSPAAEPDETPPANLIDLGMGGLILHGDHGQASQQLRMSDNLFGGIHALHLEQKIGKETLLTIDGRALEGNHDYLAKIEISQEEIGYFRAGYSEYRTWYDGNGGFFPDTPQDLFFGPERNELALDRARMFIELGLRNPMLPQVTFRYERNTRHGQKDSTIWGDTNLGSLGDRKIVPGFRNLNEVRDLFTFDICHTLGNTDFKLGARFEHENNDDSLNLAFDPTQPEQRLATQHDTIEGDMFTGHSSTETRFGKKVLFSLGYAFTTFNTDLGGSRVYGPGYDQSFDPSKIPLFADAQGFYHLVGGSEWNQHVATMNLMWRPTPALSVIAATRFESQRNDNTARFVDTFLAGIQYLQTPYEENSSDDTTNATEAFELRYTGIANWVFYARGELTQETGSVIDQVTDPLSRVTVFSADIDRERTIRKYELGTNWYPCPRATLSGEYIHMVDENGYSNAMIPSGSPALIAQGIGSPGRLTNQDFNSDRLNFRLTVRPLHNVAMISQYQLMRAEIETDPFGLEPRESGKTTDHIFSESVTWAPMGRLYLQASLSYVLSETTTPAQIVINNPVPGSHPGQIAPHGFDIQNNHWTLSASAGLALDEKSNLQAEYTYYKADNYSNNSLYTQPYGVGAEQQSFTINLSRQLRTNITANIKCGYQQYTDQTSGGHNNFSGFLLYTGLQMRF